MRGALNAFKELVTETGMEQSHLLDSSMAISTGQPGKKHGIRLTATHDTQNRHDADTFLAWFPVCQLPSVKFLSS